MAQPAVVTSYNPCTREQWDGDFEASLGYKVRTRFKNKQTRLGTPTIYGQVNVHTAKTRGNQKGRKISEIRTALKTGMVPFPGEASTPLLPGYCHWRTRLT